MNRPREVAKLIEAKPARDGAGVNIRRVAGVEALDPFLLLDEFGSDDPDDYIAGFPEHPHRGFETVTYMLAGRMKHTDSTGRTGELGPGSVQWMTAGRGIIHSEMPLQEAGLMRGFQLWVNLPAARKMTAPRYQEFSQAQIPSVTERGLTVKVIAGSYRDTEGAVRGIVTDPTYLDVGLEPGARFQHALSPNHTAIAYVYEGELGLGPSATPVTAGQLAVLGAGESFLAKATLDARLLVLAARPIGEPVVQHGPFVMNTRAEIEQAVADYRAGRLAC